MLKLFFRTMRTNCDSMATMRKSKEGGDSSPAVLNKSLLGQQRHRLTMGSNMAGSTVNELWDCSTIGGRRLLRNEAPPIH